MKTKKAIATLPATTLAKRYPMLQAVSGDLKKRERWEQLIRLGSFEDDKAKMSLMTKEELKAVKPVSFKDVLSDDNQTPSLATLKKYNDEVNAFAAFCACLELPLGFYDVRFSNIQLQVLFDVIYQNYHYLTLADLKLCLHKGIVGAYGKIFGEFKPKDVTDWLAQYVGERLEYASLQSAKRTRGQQKAQNKKPNYESKWYKKCLELAERLSEQEVKKDSFVYQSIEQYCRAKGINYAEEAKKLKANWVALYQSDVNNESISYDLFEQYQYAQVLANLNAGEEVFPVAILDESIEI